MGYWADGFGDGVLREGVSFETLVDKLKRYAGFTVVDDGEDEDGGRRAVLIHFRGRWGFPLEDRYMRPLLECLCEMTLLVVQEERAAWEWTIEGDKLTHQYIALKPAGEPDFYTLDDLAVTE